MPYHGCAVFVKTQIDTLNRSGQGTGIEAEKELWKLRKENLRACRDAFEVLQEEALFNAPGHEPQNAESLFFSFAIGRPHLRRIEREYRQYSKRLEGLSRAR